MGRIWVRTTVTRRRWVGRGVRQSACAGALAGLLAMAGTVPALAADAPVPAPSVGLKGLEASYELQLQALTGRQQLELTRESARWAQRVDEQLRRTQAETDEVATAAALATEPIRTQLAADLAAGAQRLTEALPQITQRYAAKRVERQRFVDAMAADLGPKPKPLKESDALLVRAQMKAQYELERDPMELQHDQELAPAVQQRDATVVQRKAARQGVVVDQRAAVDGIDARHAELTAGRTAQYDAAVAQLTAEQARADADHAVSLQTTKQRQADEVSRMKLAGGDVRALQARHKARLTELTALAKLQESDVSSALSAAKAGLRSDLSSFATQRSRDLAALKEDAARALEQFDADTAAVVQPLTGRVKQIEAGHKEASDDLKALYDVKTAVAVRSGYEFGTTAAALMGLIDREEKAATDSAVALERAQLQVLQTRASASAALTRAPFLRQTADIVSRSALEVSGLEDRAEAASRQLQRRHARERLLLSSDYDVLRLRAESLLDSGATGLTGLQNFYDPATDPGSLHNVADSLGLDDGSPTGAGVKVALIDTGVTDVDGLAQASVTVGPDFSFDDMSDDLRGRDAHGHGTHMAGIIVGRDDAWGAGDRLRRPERFLGIAPDAELVSVKAGAADGATDVSQVIAAINWVISYNRTSPASPIRVINLSYGTDSQQDSTIDPLSYAAERAWKAGIVVVAAAGNAGWDSNRLTNPASDPYVLAVGAVQGDGNKKVTAAYSNDGSEARTVDLVAPGRSVVSLRNPGSWSDQDNAAGRAADRFVRGSGTSQAAAVVSGAVAVLLERHPEYTPDQVKAVLKKTADDLPDADPRLSGAGVLDLAAALRSEPVYAPQRHPESDGSGSLEAARGSSHLLSPDGQPFTGERDLFGNSYAASGWADDNWTGRAWSGRAWSGRAWSGADWSGRAWSEASWSGLGWTADSWAGRAWSGRAWSESAWTGRAWSGRAWSGRAWSGRAWSENAWSGRAWSGSRWTGFGSS